MVSALDFQAGYRGFESRSGRDNFQTISAPSSYSTCPGLSIKWTGRRLVTDSGTKCAWVIHESKAVQIHAHNNRRCLYVPRVPGSVKNPHNNNNSKECRSKSVGFLLIWIYTVCKGRVYPGSAGQGLIVCLYMVSYVEFGNSSLLLLEPQKGCAL